MRCSEPSVDEMVDDPIVRALMAADGVDPRQLRRLLRSIAENLRVRRVENPQRTASRPTDAKKSAGRKEAIDAD
jgi:GTP cyclohydrolase III